MDSDFNKNNICQYNLADDSVRTVVDLRGNIAGFSLSYDAASYLAFQLDAPDASGNPGHTIGLYNLQTEESTVLINGSAPMPSNIVLCPRLVANDRWVSSISTTALWPPRRI
ncbi:MAG TPA: hypothetical protein VJC18_04550 [bacterium]|nr:hypothetical protein [bacterium]